MQGLQAGLRVHMIEVFDDSIFGYLNQQVRDKCIFDVGNFFKLLLVVSLNKKLCTKVEFLGS